MFTSIFLKRFYFNMIYFLLLFKYYFSFIIKRCHHYYINYLIIFWNVFNRRKDKQYIFIMSSMKIQ